MIVVPDDLDIGNVYSIAEPMLSSAIIWVA
jgi:hypothetical protein